MTGKWHLGQTHEHLPTAHGFEVYYGLPYSGAFTYILEQCSNWRLRNRNATDSDTPKDDMGSSAWDYYSDISLRPPLPLVSMVEGGDLNIIEQPTDLNLLSERYVNHSTKFIERSSKGKAPWFLYHAFSHVHVPNFASPKFCNSSRRGRFGDAAEALDAAVGEIMAAVDKAGVAENTITFFTSDNGPWLIKKGNGGSAGLLRDGKQTTWEGGVRVPGIVHFPGQIEAGTTQLAVAATYDISPTALSLAGVELPSDRVIDGRDLSPVLFSKDATAVPTRKKLGQKRASDHQSADAIHDCIYHWKGLSVRKSING